MAKRSKRRASRRRQWTLMPASSEPGAVPEQPAKRASLTGGCGSKSASQPSSAEPSTASRLPPRGADYTGKRVGHLIVVHRDGKGPDGSNRWVCSCDCGGTSVRTTGELRRAERLAYPVGCMSCRRARAAESIREGGERRASKLNICWQCGCLPHRRPLTGCRGCGKPYGPDVVEYALPTAGCGLGRIPF